MPSTTSLTHEDWFTANAAGVIIDEQGQTTLNGNGWHDSQLEILSTGQVVARVWSLSAVSLGFVTFGTWHQAVLRYNASTLTFDGFLDGVQSATSDTGTARSSPVGSGLGQYYVLGVGDNTNLGSGVNFNGQVDDFRVWNTALTAAEVANTANQTLVSPPPQITGIITGTTNASPIVVTSPSNGLTTGEQVTINGVLGDTAANGTWTVTVIDANTFSLNNSTGNGAYISGGTWNWTGLVDYYKFDDGAGSTFTDASGKNNNGSMVTLSTIGITQGVTGSPTGDTSCNFTGKTDGQIDLTIPQVNAAGGQNTVSFWMDWNGTSVMMPIGFTGYDLWFTSGFFGFNTGNGDDFGFQHQRHLWPQRHFPGQQLASGLRDLHQRRRAFQPTLDRRRSANSDATLWQRHRRDDHERRQRILDDSPHRHV